MKGILEFDLYEDKDTFEIAVHASDYYTVLTEFLARLRNDLKHKELSEETYKYVEDLQSDIIDSAMSYHLELT